MSNIVIIGAGVVGLTTALELKRSHPEYNITVIANYLPGDINPEYTSPYAGANWHSFAENNDYRLQQFDLISYKRLLELARTEASCGIRISESNQFHNVKDIHSIPLPWYHDQVENYHRSTENLPPGMTLVEKFTGIIITVPIYLNYLLLNALALGVEVKRVSKITHIHQVLMLHNSGNPADVVMNCTGLMANQIQGYSDEKTNYPVTGQVIHVRNNSPIQASFPVSEQFNDEMVYVFPRKEGGCIIGGCFRPKLSNFTMVGEDKQLTQRILARAKEYIPEMVNPQYRNNWGEFDIISVNVGHRPFRDSGIRIEIDAKVPWLVHNYGAGGGGYQGSYGFSEKAIELVETVLNGKELNKDKN